MFPHFASNHFPIIIESGSSIIIAIRWLTLFTKQLLHVHFQRFIVAVSKLEKNNALFLFISYDLPAFKQEEVCCVVRVGRGVYAPPFSL